MNKISVLYLLALLFIVTVRCQSDDSDILGEQQPPIQPKTQIPNTSANNQTTFTQQKTTRRQFKFDMNTLQQYRYEVGAIVAILLYLVYYRKGKAQNYEIVQKFYKSIRSYVDANFSHVGFTKNSGEDPFVAQSASEAMFYATGRNNINYLEIKFNMLKRQDMLYHLIYETIYPEKDTITIDIPTQNNAPIVFCIANKKKLKHITQSNIDLAKLVGNFDLKGMNPIYSTLGQSSQVLDTLLDQNTCKKLSDLSSLIYSIHYTDQKLFSQSQGHLRAIFYASQKNIQKYLPGLELLFHLADKIKDIKISASYKAKAYKARQAFNASVEKQKLQRHKQQLRKKKEEKRKQQQSWLRSLPPQKQKREDQKRKKKQINKLLKSRVMKVA